jgi:uncharacterized protein YukE
MVAGALLIIEKIVEAALKLAVLAKAIAEIIAAVKKIIDELRPIFEGKRATALYNNYKYQSVKLSSFPTLIKTFSDELKETASAFQAADQA